MKSVLSPLVCLALVPGLYACSDDAPPPSPDARVIVPPDARIPMPEFVLSASEQTVTEGDPDGASFTVALSEAPGREVSVTVSSSDDTLALVEQTSLTFNDDDFDTPQSVTIKGEQDDDAQNETVTLTISATGIPDATVTVTVVDDESLSIVANPTAVSVNEGETATFTVRLSAKPDASVTVAVASDDEGAATVDATELSFLDDFSTEKTITVTGVADADTSNESVTVTLSASGLADVTVTVTVTDADTQTIVVNPATVAVDEEATQTFQVSLSNDPEGTVDVSIASDDEGAVTVDPASLSFDSGNFDQPQTVTVSAVADADGDNESVSVTASSAGLTDAVVTVNVTDITPRIIVSPTSLNLTGPGNFAPISVTLSEAAASAVTVSVSGTDGETVVTFNPVTVTFATGEFDQPKVINIIAIATSGTSIVTFSAPGHAPATVLVNVGTP
ncbi:hypothetical protein [Haliangium sp.]|uniref:hypothetical protein n=1 Tax=Haliangium sp. TaxID=2663208 RepID=UPI003D0F462A